MVIIFGALSVVISAAIGKIWDFAEWCSDQKNSLNK